MKKSRVAKLLTVAAQGAILLAAAGLSRAQSVGPQMAPPSASAGNQADPYAQAFAGLTYTDKQKEAIIKIRHDIESRKEMVRKSDQLNQDQKDAMISGYVRTEYSLIYQELTPEQRKQVSTRWHAQRAAEQATQKPQAPGR